MVLNDDQTERPMLGDTLLTRLRRVEPDGARAGKREIKFIESKSGLRTHFASKGT